MAGPFSQRELMIAMFGLLVAVAMAMMKVIPGVPGHFTVYEWLALAGWIALGAIAAATRGKGAVVVAPQSSAQKKTSK
jgi:hypothetical protein